MKLKLTEPKKQPLYLAAPTTDPKLGTEGRGIARIIEAQPAILQQMMTSVMQIFMFENCRNQWSMGRPLLPLILLDNEVVMLLFVE